MEKRKCYLCGENTLKTMFSEGIYKVSRCNSCTFIEVFPKLPPNELLKIYDKGYFHSKDAKNYGYLNYLKEKENYLLTFRKRLKLVETLIPLNKNKKVLEVGFAYGFFLLVCENERFSNLTGVEIARVGYDYATKYLKHSKLLLGEVRDIKNDKFDYIFLWDIIEHLHDPKEMIKRCYQLLTNAGYLIIETQNVDSFAAKLFGKKWWHYKHKEHIYHFNKKTMKMLIKNEKFKIINITSRTAGKYISKEFIVERLNRFHPILSKLFKHMPFPKRIYVNFHDEIIIICKKEENSRYEVC